MFPVICVTYSPRTLDPTITETPVTVKLVVIVGEAFLRRTTSFLSAFIMLNDIFQPMLVTLNCSSRAFLPLLMLNCNFRAPSSLLLTAAVKYTRTEMKLERNPLNNFRIRGCSPYDAAPRFQKIFLEIFTRTQTMMEFGR